MYPIQLFNTVLYSECYSQVFIVALQIFLVAASYSINPYLTIPLLLHIRLTSLLESPFKEQTSSSKWQVFSLLPFHYPHQGNLELILQFKNAR